MHRVMSILLHAVTGKSSWEAPSSGPKRKAIKPRPPGVRLDVAKKTPKKSSSSSSASSSCNRLETCSNHPTSPAEPQVAGSTRLKSGRYRHHDLHRQRDVHLSLQSKWPSATLPQASKEHIQDQSGPTLTKCDRSVLPVWCTSELRRPSNVGLDQAVKLTIYMMLAGIDIPLVLPLMAKS